ncbi:hypothetical protein SAMN02745866_02649 [Alteromonadaceae bacterium Bs31]|nr:hypothetical protein SAMN02745866_02649 [Alteromonadaceae bacterium Bs31]
MKFKLKIDKRFNLRVTLIACASAIAMMIVRFDYPPEKVAEIALISLGLLVFVLLLAVPAALLLRWINSRHDNNGSSFSGSDEDRDEPE